jgi:hypothetical protein
MLSIIGGEEKVPENGRYSGILAQFPEKSGQETD